MKKLYFLFCFLLIGFISQAQIGKGTILLGGDLSYDQSSQSANTFPGESSFKGTNLNLSPSFGKAIKDNLVVGFDVSYGHSTNRNEPNSNSASSNGFGAGIFVRKYKPLGNGFYLFGQSRFGGAYSHGSSSSPNSGGTNTEVSDVTNGFALSLQFAPGIAFALDRRWQLEISLPNFFAVNYGHSKETVTYTGQSKEELTDNSFSAASTLTGTNTLSIGVRYLIGGSGTH